MSLFNLYFVQGEMLIDNWEHQSFVPRQGEAVIIDQKIYKFERVIYIKKHLIEVKILVSKE